MSPDSIQSLFQTQSQNRWKQSQTTASERIEKLKLLKKNIQDHEAEIFAALWKDFKKPETEVAITEIFPVVSEIQLLISKLSRWMKPKRVSTPLPLFGSRSFVHSEARGQVLVIAPWNYPFMLTMVPIVAAFAAGNTVIAKPSEKTPATSALLNKLIKMTFAENQVSIVEGGQDEAQALLCLPFDHFFFTGSTRVGQIVARAAAEQLATVTLELGGKSPTIVLPDAKLKDSVAKIAWGRMLNGGQSCVAPDHVYVPEAMRAEFVEELKKRLTAAPAKQDIARIIDRTAYSRLMGTFAQSQSLNEKVLVGGNFDANDLYISPTAIEISDNASAPSPWMREEIFGPILPVIFYRNLDEVLNYIRSQPKPLALYIFGSEGQEKVLSGTTAGGTVINHTMIHFANHSVPFGGVGFSGQGSYHGHAGFRTFSHERAVMKQSALTVTSFLFPPYNRKHVSLARWFLKLLSK